MSQADVAPGAGSASYAVPPPVPPAAAPAVADLRTFPYATFLERIAAFALDLIVVIIAFRVLGIRGPDDEGRFFLLLIAYHVGFWAWKQTTVGGIICNLRLVRTDGGRLTEASVLTVGWRLALPAAALPVVRVTPGDTLSELAAEHLGDPALAEQLFDLNTATEQPGGATLTDRNLIRPGWILTLPSGDDGPPPPVVEQPTPGEVPEDSAAVDAEQPRSSTTPVAPERTAEPAVPTTAPARSRQPRR